MRISDWSSDVCSSDLLVTPGQRSAHGDAVARHDAHASDLYFLHADTKGRDSSVSPEKFFSRQRNHVGMLAKVSLMILPFGKMTEVQPDIGGDGIETPCVRSEERRVGKECVRTCR